VEFSDRQKVFLSSEDSDLPDDDEEDSWLDEPQEAYNSAQELYAEKSSPINLASKYLTTFLANTKDDEALPLHVNKPKAATVPVPVEDDNDFSMEF
jgi:hypothetical protein